ncbi:MAG: 23S rRNA (adenine(2503)-C(2))-methyltransferase RlmN [Oscillospiraceae bacterium]|jgi:23S rRNA (adenine2503-C2)-methyltransferase
MVDIKSLTPKELSEELAQLELPGYRHKQIFRWLHRGARSFEDMTDLPKPLRAALAERFFITSPVVERRQVSRRDGTVKYLWKLSDGNCVETVLMHYRHGSTICVSSQVGCRMGCKFCASTIGGLNRNLTASEILDQVIFTAKDSDSAVSNIVLMGIGEPLDNFDNVIRFIFLVNDPEGLNIGMRHISVSTSGIPGGIDKLAAYNLQLTLSVSLHAPDDELRSKLMPVNRACGLERLMEACTRYFERTGRRVSFEYAMISGVNDSPEHALKLAALLGRSPGNHVNLIPLNPVEESPFSPSDPETVREFKDILQSHGITTTVRRRLGSDIDASCGQLRRKSMQ